MLCSSVFLLNFFFHKHTEDDIIKMLDILIDNNFFEFGGLIFQQTVSILMGTYLLFGLTCLYTFEAEFTQNFPKDKKKTNLPNINYTIRCSDVPWFFFVLIDWQDLNTSKLLFLPLLPQLIFLAIHSGGCIRSLCFGSIMNFL